MTLRHLLRDVAATVALLLAWFVALVIAVWSISGCSPPPPQAAHVRSALIPSPQPSLVQPPCACSYDVDLSQQQAPSGTSVDSYGAVGDGTTRDHAAIQAAITAAGTGGTVLFSSGKTYIVCKGIVSLTGQRWTTDGETPAVIKRCDEVRASLTAAVPQGATSVTVDSVTGFETGQYVSVAAPPPNNHDSGEVGLLQIVDIAGNVVTLSGGLSRAYDAGAILVTSFAAATMQGDGAQVDRLVFDGNRASNDSFIAWEHQQTLYLMSGDAMVVDRCQFRNAQADSLTPNGGGTAIVRDSLFEDANGAGIHLSNTHDVAISGNVIRRTNLQAARVFHAEGAITWSWTNAYPLIENNCIEDGGTAAMGQLVHDAGGNVGAIIRRNTVCRCSGIFSAKGGASWDPVAGGELGVTFERNLAVDSGSIYVWGDGNYRGMVIRDNVIHNGYISLVDVDDVLIEHNAISMADWSTYGDTQSVENAAGLVGIYGGNRVRVAHNRLLGDRRGVFVNCNNPHGDASPRSVVVEQNTVRDQEIVGISVGNRTHTKREDPAEWQTKHADCRGVVISRNEIVEPNITDASTTFRAALHTGRQLGAGEPTVIERNCIYSNRQGIFAEGRSSDPGAVVLRIWGNHIYSADEPVNYRMGLTYGVELAGNVLSAPLPTGYDATKNRVDPRAALHCGAH